MTLSTTQSKLTSKRSCPNLSMKEALVTFSLLILTSVSSVQPIVLSMMKITRERIS